MMIERLQKELREFEIERAQIESKIKEKKNRLERLRDDYPDVAEQEVDEFFEQLDNAEIEKGN